MYDHVIRIFTSFSKIRKLLNEYKWKSKAKQRLESSIGSVINFMKIHLTKIRGRPPEVFCKKVFRTNFTEQHLCRSLYFENSCRLYSKEAPDFGHVLQSLRNVSEQLFYRISANDFFSKIRSLHGWSFIFSWLWWGSMHS